MGDVTTLVIRRMSHDDVPEVASLESANQPSPWSVRVFRDELEQPNRIYLVASAETVVAFGGVMVVGEEAHVTNLLVAPEHRGVGIGRALMVSLVEEAVAVGSRHLTLEVRAGNEPARGLYSSLGLVPVGVRPRYYGDEDALILWAHDIDEAGYLEGLA